MIGIAQVIGDLTSFAVRLNDDLASSAIQASPSGRLTGFDAQGELLSADMQPMHMVMGQVTAV